MQGDDLEQIKKLHSAAGHVRRELGRVIVGQEAVVEQLLTALFSGGHCLLTGVPGLAKTLMIRTLADCLSLKFSRIQFTPDLMPADITGTEVIQEDRSTGAREFRFLHGPVFANIVLADEVNRTPPKTQAALLEAMQERQATVGGERHELPEPFFVLATQNPIEQEGTYPLPEAQLDRFMLNVMVDYPSEDEELEIVRRTTADVEEHVSATLTAEEILAQVRVVRRVPAAEHVMRYALQLARLSRRSDDAPQVVRDFVHWGAGPRASQYLVLAAKARAALAGRCAAEVDDVRAMALPVLRHRILTNFNAEAEGITPDEIVRRLIAAADEHAGEVDSGGRLPEIFKSADAL
jgi:MoxR-like ATPase